MITLRAVLYRIIYASLASHPAGEDVAGILDWSQPWNEAADVTGLLCLLDGVYMQYLEGDASVVDGLFASIRQDGRHRRVTLLERRAIARRAFAGWSMKLMVWSEEAMNIFRSFSPECAVSLYESDPATAAPMLRALAATPGWAPTEGLL